MTDPFEQLRGSHPDVTPDVGVIKSRARGMMRRRHIALSSGAAVIAVIATIGLITVDNDPLRNAADDLALTTAAPEAATTSSDALGSTSSGSGGSTLVEPTTTPSRAAIKAAPGTSSGAAGSRTTGSGGTTAAAGGDAKAPPASLAVTLIAKDLAIGTGAEFTLEACNKGSAPVERGYSSAQRYDFEVRTPDDGRVWVWSEGKAFAQVTGTEKWAPGECKQWTERWDGMRSNGRPATPGDYEAVGTLRGDPTIVTAPKSFCLDVCGN